MTDQQREAIKAHCLHDGFGLLINTATTAGEIFCRNSYVGDLSGQAWAVYDSAGWSVREITITEGWGDE